MSIISEALKKAAEKRDDVVRIPIERKPEPAPPVLKKRKVFTAPPDGKKKEFAGFAAQELKRSLDTPDRDLNKDLDLERRIQAIAVKEKQWKKERKSRLFLSIFGMLLTAGVLIATLSFYGEIASLNDLKPPLDNKYLADIINGIAVRASTPKVVPEEEGAPLPPELLRLELRGVVQGEGGALAMINERILGKGEMIYGATVAAIEVDKVELSFDGQNFTLYMD